MPNPQALQKLVQQFAGRLKESRVSIAVVGDMILDKHVEGTPGGRHPEIGVPILRDVTTQESIGGAANIALALTRLGVEPALFGVIGSDLPGRQLENLLDRQPFASHLITERGWPTPTKDWIYQRQDGRLSPLQRIDYDRPLSGRAREELVGEFRARCPAGVQVVILVDHGLGSIGTESLALIGLAKERRAKLVAIPRTAVLRGQPLDAIVINSPEMRCLSNAGETAEPRVLAARYALEYAQGVFLTMLGEGILVCPAGQRAAGTLIPGYPLENAQWMGARDMATAIVALGMALGLEALDIGHLANAFRSLVADQRGNGRVTWRDIHQFVGLPE
ncbi:MAG TPA: PfkB family carbohydrate kinase [Gemmataceae bacterium]|jgi:D-beta-D-heptose 7-phosphate kinase/D-beta-D-heptose 1-phosphate adenosyltransferase|nr:PfkB family carbohydrate kinase [Gemmataceae bacterium]